jgi:hypothetical protein
VRVQRITNINNFLKGEKNDSQGKFTVDGRRAVRVLRFLQPWAGSGSA